MNREIEDIVARSQSSEAQRIKALWKQERMIRARRSGGSVFGAGWRGLAFHWDGPGVYYVRYSNSDGLPMRVSREPINMSLETVWLSPRDAADAGFTVLTQEER